MTLTDIHELVKGLRPQRVTLGDPAIIQDYLEVFDLDIIKREYPDLSERALGANDSSLAGQKSLISAMRDLESALSMGKPSQPARNQKSRLTGSLAQQLQKAQAQILSKPQSAHDIWVEQQTDKLESRSKSDFLSDDTWLGTMHGPILAQKYRVSRLGRSILAEHGFEVENVLGQYLRIGNALSLGVRMPRSADGLAQLEESLEIVFPGQSKKLTGPLVDYRYHSGSFRVDPAAALQVVQRVWAALRPTLGEWAGCLKTHGDVVMRGKHAYVLLFPDHLVVSHESERFSTTHFKITTWGMA